MVGKSYECTDEDRASLGAGGLGADEHSAADGECLTTKLVALIAMCDLCNTTRLFLS
jgi:hypothetical protein